MHEARFAALTAADLDWVVTEEAALQAHPWTRGNFEDSLVAGHEAWGMWLGEQPAAYAIVLRVLDEAHLLTIGVTPALQGQGLGGRFLGWLCARAQHDGVASFYLEVRPSNRAALALYTRADFVEIGRRRGYYPAQDGREDAIVMRRAL
jgi:ribosomal-protein-alanine N-acetyltransferase